MDVDSHYSVKLGKLIEDFELDVLRGAEGYREVLIQREDVNRPGLQLVGFFDYFDAKRMQLLGRVESTYLAQLSPEERLKSFDELLAHDIPALVITRGMEPFPECMEMAEKYNRTILRTQETTTAFMGALIAALRNYLAPRITRHGVLVEVYGEGILLIGDSGIVREDQDIDLVVNLEQWNDNTMYDRLGLEELYTVILDVKVPALTVPVKPGRNLAIIVEVAAMNNRHKKMGYNAAQAFTQQINEHFDQALSGQM